MSKRVAYKAVPADKHVQIRINAALMDRVRDSAEKNFRSFAQEVCYRLQLSLDAEGQKK